MNLILVCEKCGETLDGEINRNGDFEIYLCSACEKAIKEEEYKKGYAEGYEEGNKE